MPVGRLAGCVRPLGGGAAVSGVRHALARLACGAVLAVCAVGAGVSPAPAIAAGPSGFRAGAATVDITPRLASAADPNGFLSNPRCLGMTGPRTWADEEPYVDVMNKGHYVDGDPYCDLNGNGRHDDIYDSGATIGTPRPATSVHDRLQARAFAVYDGTSTDVVVSVAAQGLFNTYIDRMIAKAKKMAPSITDMVVSANHNESSPDTIGIYGGPAPTFGGQGPPAGLQSGIDDYYMTYLVDQVAAAAANAVRQLRAASLWARQTPVPANLSVNLSDNWPTTGVLRAPTAIDPKAGVLQARDANGAPIFTVMSLAAHNQEIGHSGSPALSADWPGYFQSEVDRRLGGTSLLLVADNGSEEDPQTNTGSFAQAQATGLGFADLVSGHAPQAQRLREGQLRYKRTDFCVPIENNLFKAAAAAGLFGQRVTYVNQGGTCVQSGASGGASVTAGPTVPGAPDSLMTTASLLDVGPDLQLLDNPGESFPGLVLGSPWRFADVPTGCNARPNPPVPTWPAHGEFRFQVGLANDMIGYEIPAWAYISDPGTFTTTDQPNCATVDSHGHDSAGHQHKLETEGVGPTASNAVADALTGLVTADAPDPSAQVTAGRYVLPDGSYSQFPAGAAGILIPPDGTSSLDPAGGTLIARPDTAGFGARPADATGFFMDYDGQPQAAADVTTRGMIVLDSQGCVVGRHYVNVFPSLGTSAPLGRQSTQAPVLPVQGCTSPAAGVPQVQASVADQLGLPRVQAAVGTNPSGRSPGGPGRAVGCVPKSLRFRLGSPRGRAIVRVRVYVNGRLVAVRRGRHLRRLVIPPVARPAGYRLRIDTFTRRGLFRRSVRSVRGCRRGRPRTIGRHGRGHGGHRSR